MLNKTRHPHLASLPDINAFLTPNEEAVREVHLRNTDSALRTEVENYLNHDVPPHFLGEPIGYLARHVATPNFETLRFIEIAKSLHLPAVIGEDGEDLFVSQNSLKRALGKLSLLKGKSKNFEDIVEYITVIDFAVSQGKPLKEVYTLFREPLMEFHANLMKAIYPTGVTVVNESAWISRHHRGNLVEHYKKLLSLFVAHGVMFEYYPVHDVAESAFVREVLAPAFAFVEGRFGVRPLITPLIPDTLIGEHDWEGYPSVLYKLIKNKMEEK